MPRLVSDRIPILSKSERTDLSRLARRQRDQAVRARIVLCAAAGVRLRAIARRFSLSRLTVRLWLDRFRAKRTRGLEARKPGRVMGSTCTRCGGPRDADYAPTCKGCNSERMISYSRFQKRRRYVRRYGRYWHASGKARAANLKHKYGLTEVAYNARLKAQGGKCAICRAEPPNGVRLFVDHNHNAGNVRGLLCSGCNCALAFMRDDPRRLRKAIKYLKKNGDR